jgi:tetratricopeptide (TPR) repeat protein
MMRRLAIALLFASLCAQTWAQADPLTDAWTKYRAGDLAGARAMLDVMVQQPSLSENGEAWLFRGFVYKDLYKRSSGADADQYRDEAMGSLITSTRLPLDTNNRMSAMLAYDYLAKTYYNDAATALNEMNVDRGQFLYGKYAEAQRRMYPQQDLRARDVEFLNAMGTVYMKLYNQDREDLDRFNRAVEAYAQVLALQRDNYGANYNLATLYYNRGVYNIQRLGPETSLISIDQVQDASKEFFLQALPFMEKAHGLDPKRRETLIGLENIYYSLQQKERAEHFKMLQDALPAEPQR